MQETGGAIAWYFLSCPPSHSHGGSHSWWYWVTWCMPQSQKLYSHMVSRAKLSSPGYPRGKTNDCSTDAPLWSLPNYFRGLFMRTCISEENHAVLQKQLLKPKHFLSCYCYSTYFFFFHWGQYNLSKSSYKMSKALAVALAWKIGFVPKESPSKSHCSKSLMMHLKSVQGCVI